MEYCRYGVKPKTIHQSYMQVDEKDYYHFKLCSRLHYPEKRVHQIRPLLNVDISRYFNIQYYISHKTRDKNNLYKCRINCYPCHLPLLVKFSKRIHK